MSKVILFHQKKYNEQIINEMVEKIFKELFHNNPNLKTRTVKNVVIKPNMMYYWDASTGETTDLRVVSSVIDNLRRRFGDDVDISVVESDASAMRTKYSFKILGFDKLCEKKEVKLVNLSEGDSITKKIHLNQGMVKIMVNKLLLSADFVVNIPKLKIHRNPPVMSCALKNFFGLISTPYKFQYHSKLSLYISAINKLVKSNLVIVDGLVVLGKYPKKLGLIIGADDAVSCDMVATKIAVRNPKRDILISNALLEGLGNENFQLIDPDSVFNTVRDEFPKFNSFVMSLLWSIQLNGLKTYIKLTGDILPPVLSN